MGTSKKYVTIVIVLVLVLLFMSCSGLAPTIEELDWRLIYRDDGQFKREEILIFMRISDPDDDTDPSRVIISAKDTGLKWSFNREQWISLQNDGVQWWGLPAMIPLEGEDLPDSLYVVLLTDLAGKSVQTQFRLNPERPNINAITWPLAEVDSGILRLSNYQGEAKLITRNANKQVVQIIDATQNMPLNSDDLWWEIWISLGDTRSGIRIGPYSTSL